MPSKWKMRNGQTVIVVETTCFRIHDDKGHIYYADEAMNGIISKDHDLVRRLPDPEAYIIGEKRSENQE